MSQTLQTKVLKTTTVPPTEFKREKYEFFFILFADFLTQGQQAIVFIVGTFNRLSTDELNLPLRLLKDGAVAPSSGGITVGPELFIHITGNKMSMYENIKDKFGKRNTAVEI